MLFLEMERSVPQIYKETVNVESIIFNNQYSNHEIFMSIVACIKFELTETDLLVTTLYRTIAFI